MKFGEETRRASRDLLPLSLLMIDVDYFKLYNDSQGHQKGDECLRAIAHRIADTLWRETDFAARYGGEEFTVVMPNTPLSGAMLIAERLRNAVEELQHRTRRLARRRASSRCRSAASSAAAATSTRSG